MTFEQLKLIPPILKALSAQGYTEPTPIQQRAIPPALEGRDLLGCAQTGTGKTAAFALPILQRLHAAGKQPGRRPIRSLILTPTRELALQIHENLVAYGKNLPLRSAVIFGGVSQNPQTDELERGVDLLVATPGRLNDLINQGYVHLEAVEIFVLDEADRMLDMGFIHDVRKVIARLPQQRQTMLFSATMPGEIEQLADSLLRHPVKVEVAPPATTVELIEQSVYLTDKAKKRQLLVWVLQNPSIYSALVFTRTKHGADRVAKILNGAKIPAQAIHGDKSQGARQQALANFKSGKSAYWLPPILPRAESISILFPMSSTLSFPMSRKPMSTGSAGPAAPERRERLSPSVTLTNCPISRKLKSSPGRKFLLCRRILSRWSFLNRCRSSRAPRVRPASSARERDEPRLSGNRRSALRRSAGAELLL